MPDGAHANLIADALPRRLTWTDRPTDADLAQLPNAPAVLLFEDEHQRPIQLLTTQQLRRSVLTRLSSDVDTPKRRADVGAIARAVRWRDATCPFESRWQYYRLARTLHPRDYRRLVAFGPAWFLGVDWSAAIPEIRVTDRVDGGAAELAGPWPTHRDAQAALEGLWDLFDLCRYPEQIRRAPQGLRCAYADMGRCDAPCDGSAPLAAYVERMRAAWRLALGESDAWIASAAERMRAAAHEQRFEAAALLKQQIAFATRWKSDWPLAGPLARLDRAIALPVTRRKAWKLFGFRGGALVDGPVVADRKAEAGIAAWYAEFRNAAPPELDGEIRTEQTWLLCHLLFGREAAAAIAIPVPADAGMDINAEIRTALEARRATATGMSSAPSVPETPTE